MLWAAQVVTTPIATTSSTSTLLVLEPSAAQEPKVEAKAKEGTGEDEEEEQGEETVAERKRKTGVIIKPPRPCLDPRLVVNLYFQSSGLTTGPCIYIYMHFGSFNCCCFYIDFQMLSDFVYNGIYIYIYIYL